jgi:hypothetical protein
MRGAHNGNISRAIFAGAGFPVFAPVTRLKTANYRPVNVLFFCSRRESKFIASI